MSFFFVTFNASSGGRFKAHYCPDSLVGGLVADAELRGGSTDKVEETTVGGMDLPGICMADRPIESMMIGEFEFSVPSQDFESILAELQRVGVRKFSDGQEYYKIHGHFHCLVLTVNQRDALLVSMSDMLPGVRERADEANEEFSRRMADVNKGKLRAISHRDENAPGLVRVPEPPKENN